MNKKYVRGIWALSFIGIGVLVAFVLIFRGSKIRPTSSVEKTGASLPIIDSSMDKQSVPLASPGSHNFNSSQWQEWRKRNAEDPKWEWKVPIRFYGQILDQNDSPVEGATVTLSWTDLSAKGVSLRQITSDRHGRFSLSNVNGKHLLVRSIEKQGYEYSTTNRDGFEYAAFFDESYYIPDSGNPVIFRMHKKTGGDPLIVVSNKYRIPSDSIVAVDLKTGRQGGNDVSIELVNNSDPTGKVWAAKIRAPGGIRIANDEFSTIAPESGYVSEVSIDQDTVQPSGFQSGSLYKGGKFFVKTTAGYALIEFRMIPGNKSITFLSYLNPVLGSRNLEIDPAKVTKSP